MQKGMSTGRNEREGSLCGLAKHMRGALQSTANYGRQS